MLNTKRLRVSTSSTPMQAAKKRGASVANIWHFQSPKNRKRVVFVGDLVFMYAVIIEGDVNVENYQINDMEIDVCVEGTIQSFTPAIKVQLTNGSTEWIDFQSIRGRGKTSTMVAGVHQVMRPVFPGIYRIVTDKDLLGSYVLFENWLNLCGMINRCRHLFCGNEDEILLNFFRQNKQIPLSLLLDSEGVDRARMLASVARALQAGIITADLSKSHLTPVTQLNRCRDE